MTTRTPDELLLRFDGPDGSSQVIVEDDGRVAYAYLAVGGKLVSDVWLYNVVATPETVNWRDREQMPFLNPRSFCRADLQFPRLHAGSDVRCAWGEAEGAVTAELIVDGLLVARLQTGSKPGWSLLASKKGPLAVPLQT